MSVEELHEASPEAGAEPAVVARVRRFTALRAAQRALTPSVRAPEMLPTAEQAAEVRDRLEALTGPTPGQGAGAPAHAEPEELAALDTALDGYARQLRVVLDRVPLPQFRAALPPLVHTHRDEVTALLDLCVEEASEIWARLPLVDYLVTLLCIQRSEDDWTIARDPARLSPLVARRCEEAFARGRQEETEAVARFRDASERLAAGERVDVVVAEMGAYKKAIAGSLFVPEVLRSVVSYNVSVRNLREQGLSRTRKLDLELSRRAGLAPQAPSTAQATDTAAATKASRSAFESQALAAIERAFAARLAGEAVPEDAAGRLAAHTDLSRLGAFEVEAFTAGEYGELQACVRRVVVLGLAVEQLAEIGEELAALGVDTAVLRREWIREAGDRIQAQINKSIGIDSFDLARGLSDTKTRFLYEPLSSLRREQARKGVPGGPPGHDGGAAQREVRELAEAHERREAAPERRPRRALGERALRHTRWGLAAVLVLASCLALALQHFPRDPRQVGTVAAVQLGDISPLLVTGYRSRRGEGPFFVGTLAASWKRMSAAERHATAQRIGARFAETGVYELMLFDASHALQVHYVNDQVRFPPAPAVPR